MSGSISDALASLSDRGLRRLLGARTFLRGLEFFRRKAVSEVSISGAKASGRVRANNDAEPFRVDVGISTDGIVARCNCPIYAKSSQNCKHIAALLIDIRDQARAKQRAAKAAMTPNTAHAGGESKRARRRRARLTAAAAAGVAPNLVTDQNATAGQTGIAAWLPPPGVETGHTVEMRVHVRQGALTVTVLDVDARVAVLPSVALTWQAIFPTPDRDALRLLARFESGNPRHPAVDVRGEDVADLLPMLRKSKILLEPALKQLRFSDDVLRPCFELETVGGQTIILKAAFQRPDGRRFGLLQGGWFEGWPSWHIDTQEGIARQLDPKVSPAALRRLLKSPTIAEPVSQVGTVLMQGLPKVALEMGAELPDLDQFADVVEMDPTFRMRAGGSLMEASVSLYAAYGDRELPVRADGLTLPIIIQPPKEGAKRPVCLRVDIAAQQAAVAKLLELGLRADETGEHFEAAGDYALHFWTEGLGELPETWDLFVPEHLVDTQIRSTSVDSFARVTSGVDWLNVNLEFTADGVGVGREELRRCIQEGKKYVQLDDGSFAAFDTDKVQAMLDREIELLASADEKGRLPLSHAGRVSDLMNQVNKATVATKAKSLFNKLNNLDEIAKIRKPRTLKATLRPYQESGLNWLRFIHDLRSGGVLADDMGLGKTVQTIALFCSVKSKDKKLTALIVAPTSVVRNWQREIERFAPSLSVSVWHGPDRQKFEDEARDANIVITSYSLLRRDGEFFDSLNLDYAVLDEAQHIKNPHSATAKAARELKTGRRLALTGTPIENRLTEIWSIFEFVSPGLLGPLDQFEKKYSRPIEQGDYKAAQRLRNVIHPFILRRTKGEVAKDLPEKIETNQVCDLPTEQRTLYNQIAAEVRAQVLGQVEKAGMAKSQIQILAGITKLRQAACDPRLLRLPKDYTDLDSAKLIALRELLQNAVDGGHKVLVFSQFVQMLKLIEKAAKADGIRYEYLDGSTRNRSERIERFQEDPTVSAFFISLKAGGTGLNLTAADTVVHFDPWWNPAVEDQATDRAHRIGQKKVVSVYRLVAAGTIEEKILELKDKKRALVSSVLTEDFGGKKKLTKTDLEDLFAV